MLHVFHPSKREGYRNSSVIQLCHNRLDIRHVSIKQLDFLAHIYIYERPGKNYAATSLK
jgi:hypothetical protein